MRGLLKLMVLALVPLMALTACDKKSDAAPSAAYDLSPESNARFLADYAKRPGVVRVADALDMEHGRSRANVETSLANIHSLSSAAIDEVKIIPGEQRAVRVEVLMNNSAGVFQVDSLLANKLRGSGLEDHIEVVARIDAEHEKRLLRVYQI